jgi:RimJ/RimL family protein N-acetyltransferase
MKLLPLEKPELIELVARWLGDEENWKWLDFGGNRQPPTPALVKIMAQRETNALRVFTADDEITPIGVFGLNNINRAFKTASAWVVLGEKSYTRQGYATRASRAVLTLGFRELGLEAITSWAVEGNPSLEIHHRLKFHFVGRQRRCHWINGRAHDRLLFDILASEHQEASS